MFVLPWHQSLISLGFAKAAIGLGGSILANFAAMQNDSPVSPAVEPLSTVPAAATVAPVPAASPPPEFGGPKGPEPTRYGDWEKNGRCIDF